VAGSGDAERRYAAVRDVVAELQEALLPIALPVLPRLRIAARYLAAGLDQAPGGDLFDAVLLAGGAVALVVGDVVGHGLAASAAMGQLRAVLNELLLAEPDLATVLTRLDAFAARTPTLRAATLALAVLDPAGGSMRYATCGHPPPLVISSDGTTRFLPGTGTGPLGTGPPGTGSAAALATGTLEPGEMLLLYSDGLIERPGRTVPEGMTELAEAAAAAMASQARLAGVPAAAADRVCQLTVELLARAGYADDVTALAAQRLAHPVPALQLELPAEIASLHRIRDGFDGWLAQLSPLAADQDDLRLAIVEIVTNAIEHAYPAGQPGPVGLRAAIRDDGMLECHITDRGTWREPDLAVADRGHGLMIAGHMADQIQVHHLAQTEHAAGTTVTLRRRLRRPAVLASGTSASPAAYQGGPAFSVDIVPGGPVPAVTVRGPVDITTVGQLTRQLLTASRGGTLPLVVDLSQVTHLASGGVRALYQVIGQLKDHKQDLTLLAPLSCPAHAVLELVRLPHSEPPAAHGGERAPA